MARQRSRKNYTEERHVSAFGGHPLELHIEAYRTAAGAELAGPVKALADLGVTDAEQLVALSSIPDVRGKIAESIGVGKAECNLHAAYWIPDAAQRPLVAIRAELAALGLRRLHESAVYEDQLGALCEVMRVLIAGAPGREPEPVAVQKQFFERFLSGWVDECCGAISQCPVANYYRRVAQFTTAFMAVERDSLAID